MWRSHPLVPLHRIVAFDSGIPIALRASDPDAECLSGEPLIGPEELLFKRRVRAVWAIGAHTTPPTDCHPPVGFRVVMVVETNADPHLLVRGSAHLPTGLLGGRHLGSRSTTITYSSGDSKPGPMGTPDLLRNAEVECSHMKRSSHPIRLDQPSLLARVDSSENSA